MNKNVFCDWINDVDYLKRNLVCESTLKVIERRMEQSEALIFVESENSRKSVWCKYELNYFTELNRPIFMITKDHIDDGVFELQPLDSDWYIDPDYKSLALLEGKSIKA